MSLYTTHFLSVVIKNNSILLTHFVPFLTFCLNDDSVNVDFKKGYLIPCKSVEIIQKCCIMKGNSDEQILSWLKVHHEKKKQRKGDIPVSGVQRVPQYKSDWSKTL